MQLPQAFSSLCSYTTVQGIPNVLLAFVLAPSEIIHVRHSAKSWQPQRAQGRWEAAMKQVTTLGAHWAWNLHSLQGFWPWGSVWWTVGLTFLMWVSLSCWHLALIWIYPSSPTIFQTCFYIFDSQEYGFGTHFMFYQEAPFTLNTITEVDGSTQLHQTWALNSIVCRKGT